LEFEVLAKREANEAFQGGAPEAGSGLQKTGWEARRAIRPSKAKPSRKSAGTFVPKPKRFSSSGRV